MKFPESVMIAASNALYRQYSNLLRGIFIWYTSINCPSVECGELLGVDLIHYAGDISYYKCHTDTAILLYGAGCES